jgi:Fe-S-cluster containining protein
MHCRPQCGACCIALSITTPMPGMPNGKPAGVACLHLTPDRRCAIHGRPERPACCAGLQPSLEMCGETPADAIAYLAELERLTRP